MITAPAIVVVVLLLAGAMLLRFGLVGRRLDDHPICRKCRFDLVGVYEPGESSEAVKCPECGIDLSAQRVAKGNRRRRKGTIALGALLLVLAVGIGGAFGWGAASGFNWNSIKPTWLLQREAGGGSPETVRAALDELIARLESEELGEATARELIAVGLQRQADLDLAWEPRWGDLIETAYFMNRLDHESWARYLRQCLPDSSIDVSTRERLRLGDPVPCRVTISKPRLGDRTSVMLQIGSHAAGNVLPDGTERPVEIGRSHARLGLAGGGSGRVSWSMDLDLAVGVHNVWVDWMISPMVGGAVTGEQGGDPIEWTMRFEETIEVVPPGAPLVELVAAPDLAQKVRDSLTIQRMSIRAGPAEGPLTSSGTVQFTNPPIDMAFDVVWVAGGKEFLAGDVAITQGQKTHGHGIWGQIEGFDAESVDVILRPSARAAMQTTELTRIWGGEVRFEDVPVEWPEK